MFFVEYSLLRSQLESKRGSDCTSTMFSVPMVMKQLPARPFDQLMRIGWKVFLPMSLAWVVLISFLAKFEVLGGFWARWAVGA